MINLGFCTKLNYPQISSELNFIQINIVFLTSNFTHLNYIYSNHNPYQNQSYERY